MFHNFTRYYTKSTSIAFNLCLNHVIAVKTSVEIMVVDNLMADGLGEVVTTGVAYGVAFFGLLLLF